MKFLAVVLAVAVLAQVNSPFVLLREMRQITFSTFEMSFQGAEIPKLFPRSDLYPRAPVPQGPGYFVPTKQAHTVDTRAFCGQRQVDNSRIVGGVEAVPHEFPWYVQLINAE